MTPELLASLQDMATNGSTAETQLLAQAIIAMQPAPAAPAPATPAAPATS